MSGTALGTKYLGANVTPALRVVRQQGSFLFDAKGRKYIDFVMGWCVGNFGWKNPEIIRAAERYQGPDYIYPEYSYAPWGELARLLASIAPGKLRKSFRATGGSEAVELALQAAMLRTRRRKFVALDGSYHGNTIGALSIADRDNRKKLKNLLGGCNWIGTPLDEKSIGKVETLLKRRDVAALIMEPISINLGVLIPDKSFMTELQRLCRRYGTLLVMDEVACGFCRTGKIFATDHFGIEPDIMCLGKAITGGVAGMGATVMTEDVAEPLEEDGDTWSTFGWHPRSVNVAIAIVNYIIRHRKKLLAHVMEMSDYFAGRLSQMEFESGGSVSIRGLAIGVDLDHEEYAERVADRCLRGGLLVTTQDTKILLLPALTIEPRVAERGLDILEKSL